MNRLQEALLRPVSPQTLEKHVHFLSPTSYAQVEQERSLDKLCGYPLCANSTASKYCTRNCTVASLYLKSQISREPLAMRRKRAFDILDPITMISSTAIRNSTEASDSNAQIVDAARCMQMLGLESLPANNNLTIVERVREESDHGSANTQVNTPLIANCLEGHFPRPAPSVSFAPDITNECVAPRASSSDDDSDDYSTVDDRLDQSENTHELQELGTEDPESDQNSDDWSSDNSEPVTTLGLSLFGRAWTRLNRLCTNNTRSYLAETHVSTCSLIPKKRVFMMRILKTYIIFN